MIQKNSYIKIVDNSGGKQALCIHVVGGYRNRYGRVGDLVVVTVKSVRSSKKSKIRVKRGDVLLALILRTKSAVKLNCGTNVKFLENSGVLLSRQKKILGTRIFGSILSIFRGTSFLKIVTLGAGVSL